MTRGARRLVAVAFVLIAAAAGYAGLRMWGPFATVQNARYLEFSASPDHAAVDMSGTPIVKKYILEIYPAGAATPAQTIDLGKPAPSPDGMIRIELSSLPIATLPAGVTYEAAITAVGPHGQSGSDRSNRFAFAGTR